MVKWSGEGTHFILAATLRMAVSLILGGVLLKVTGTRLGWCVRARKAYLAAGLGTYFTMAFCYWAAQKIPSGWISVIYGLQPMITAIIASAMLKERGLTPLKLVGMLLCLSGMGAIFREGAAIGMGAGLAVASTVVGVISHSFFVVWIKKVDAELSPLALTVGGAAVSLVFFIAHCLFAEVPFPADLPTRSILAILYLGGVGSVLGFVLYFYLLKRIAATSLALLAFITPVIALMLGTLLNGEVIKAEVWLGCTFILAGLFYFSFDGRLPKFSLSGEKVELTVANSAYRAGE
jgi:drug/metabolite transporter (DMT)-like permease